MSRRNCDCKNVTIVEGIFGEIFSCIAKENEAESQSHRGSSVADMEYEGSGCGCKPIKIKSYTMTNANKVEVVLITWGATIVSIKCPDKDANVKDIVLGFSDLNTYLDPSLNRFIGCILGRCANRIKNASFKIRDKDYGLTKNSINKHHLHGGTNGFGRRIWESYVEENRCVVMSYLSEDGEEGYPGAVLATLKFALTNDNRLEISMRASTSKPTVVNLSHGSLFNLAGHDAGEVELRQHTVSLNCDRWTVIDCENNHMPTGEIRGVGGTIMDIRIPRPIGQVMDNLVPVTDGFDHNFCVIRTSQPKIAFVSRVCHPKTGRFLEVYSDQPGVQFYTGGHLPPYPVSELPDAQSVYECAKSCDCESQDASSHLSGNNTKTIDFLPGKFGAEYKKYGAFSIQPQNYPDAVNIASTLPKLYTKTGASLLSRPRLQVRRPIRR